MIMRAAFEMPSELYLQWYVIIKFNAPNCLGNISIYLEFNDSWDYGIDHQQGLKKDSKWNFIYLQFRTE